MRILGTAKVSEKLRTTLVKRVAEILNVEKGDYIAFVENDDGEIVVKKG